MISLSSIMQVDVGSETITDFLFMLFEAASTNVTGLLSKEVSLRPWVAAALLIHLLG